MRELDVSAIDVPAAIVPSGDSVAPGVRVTVLPLAVVDLVGVVGFAFDGAGLAGVVARGAVAAADGAGAGVLAAGTSFRAGVAAVSALASCISRFSVESCARVSFFLSPLQAATATSASTVGIATNVRARCIYFDMGV